MNLRIVLAGGQMSSNAGTFDEIHHGSPGRKFIIYIKNI